MRVALLTGALNLTVALVVITFLKTQVYKRVYKVILSFLGLIGLCSIFIFSDPIKAIIEKSLFQDQVLLSTQSEYQQIILTGHRDDLRLYLNGDLQFSSVDEYRYHETLVHIPLGLSPNPRNVLLLGAGDGLAVREILKHSSVESITLVDLDPKIVELSSQYPLLRQLNNESLASNKLKIVNHDAFSYMLSNTKLYDVVIVDLPDPNDENLGRLYTQEFYQLINRSLTPAGVMITQAGSPYFTKDAFWSIQVTLQEVFKNTLPIQVEVPSFGLWGFQLASEVPLDITKIKLPKDLKYLTSDIIPVLSIFGADVSKDTSTTQVSTLDNLHVIKAYRQGREEFE
jgi:spermidine synthase